MDEKESMTALTSLFARAWHNEEYAVRVLEDDVSRKLMTDEEYESICSHMAGGISFFNPQFEGTPKQALAHIAAEYLCPSVLSRGAFTEDSLYVLGENHFTREQHISEFGMSCGFILKDLLCPFILLGNDSRHFFVDNLGTAFAERLGEAVVLPGGIVIRNIRQPVAHAKVSDHGIGLLSDTF